MEIKVADSKGRVLVGEKGAAYAVKRHDHPKGSVTLTPLSEPETGQPDGGR
jgi:hypothetical protein